MKRGGVMCSTRPPAGNSSCEKSIYAGDTQYSNNKGKVHQHNLMININYWDFFLNRAQNTIHFL